MVYFPDKDMNLLLTSLLRGGIPFVIMSSIALILQMQGKFYEAKSTFVVAVICLFVGAATVIYQRNSWTLAKQTLVHFFVMLLTVYPLLLWSDWFKRDTFVDIFIVLLLFVLVGVLLWCGIMVFRKLFDLH